MPASPTQLDGAWHRGWALDVHTTASVFLGYDAQGRERWDSARSELGEHLYQLKYRRKQRHVQPIASQIAAFVASKPPLLAKIDFVVPVPASTKRPFQPVVAIAHASAKLLKKPCFANAVEKTRKTNAIKSVRELDRRVELLEGAFTADPAKLLAKGVLLIDDLYRSGATANAVTRALVAAGASHVFFLAVTRTRTHT